MSSSVFKERKILARAKTRLFRLTAGVNWNAERKQESTSAWGSTLEMCVLYNLLIDETIWDIHMFQEQPSDGDCKVWSYKSIQRSPEKRFCLHCKMNTSKGCLSWNETFLKIRPAIIQAILYFYYVCLEKMWKRERQKLCAKFCELMICAYIGSHLEHTTSAKLCQIRFRDSFIDFKISVSM